MFPWQDLLRTIAEGIVYLYLDLTFWLVLALVAVQYWRGKRSHEDFFGVPGENVWQQTGMAFLYGTLGGIVGSFLLAAVGVSLNRMGLSYIWPVALILAFIHMRFLCFAYAGGLVALCRVVTGWPDVDVPQVLALVAVLHMTESFLIAISGRNNQAPLFLRRPDGRVVGAFSLQNFWPLPLVMLLAIPIPEGFNQSGAFHMPDWWPLLKLAEMTPEDQWMFTMLPVVAALGYADVAVTQLPAVRRRRSALYLACYSLVLLGLSIASSSYGWLQLVAALLSPLGHELLIQIDNRQEMKGKPLFVQPETGVMVLDTVPGSLARQIGVKPGDVLIRLSNMAIDRPGDLGEALRWAPVAFSLEVQRQGEKKILAGKFDGERWLGVLLAPGGWESDYVEIATGHFGIGLWLKRIWQRWKGKIG